MQSKSVTPILQAAATNADRQSAGDLDFYRGCVYNHSALYVQNDPDSLGGPSASTSRHSHGTAAGHHGSVYDNSHDSLDSGCRGRDKGHGIAGANGTQGIHSTPHYIRILSGNLGHQC